MGCRMEPVVAHVLQKLHFFQFFNFFLQFARFTAKKICTCLPQKKFNFLCINYTSYCKKKLRIYRKKITQPDDFFVHELHFSPLILGGRVPQTPLTPPPSYKQSLPGKCMGVPCCQGSEGEGRREPGATGQRGSLEVVWALWCGGGVGQGPGEACTVQGTVAKACPAGWPRLGKLLGAGGGVYRTVAAAIGIGRMQLADNEPLPFAKPPPPPPL